MYACIHVCTYVYVCMCWPAAAGCAVSSVTSRFSTFVFRCSRHFSLVPFFSCCFDFLLCSNSASSCVRRWQLGRWHILCVLSQFRLVVRWCSCSPSFGCVTPLPMNWSVTAVFWPEFSSWKSCQHVPVSRNAGVLCCSRAHEAERLAGCMYLCMYLCVRFYV